MNLPGRAKRYPSLPDPPPVGRAGGPLERGVGRGIDSPIRWRQIWLLAVLAIVVALGFGCASTPERLQVAFPLDSTPKPIPISVGYYFGPDTAKYAYLLGPQERARLGLVGGTERSFPIGAASVELFSKAFAMTFARAEPVQRIPPPTLAASPPDAFIRLDLEEFHLALGYLAEITYRCTLYSPDGAAISSWRVFGRANTGRAGYYVINRTVSLAMQDAATRLVADFREFPGVRAWLERTPAAATAPDRIWKARRDISADEIRGMPIVLETDTYLIGADAYVEAARRDALMGPDSARTQLTPVRVAVMNKGAERIWVLREGASLSAAGLTGAPPTITSRVSPFVLAPGGIGVGASLASAIEMLAALPSFMAAYEQWEKRTELLFQSYLTDTLLGQGDSMVRFLYFPASPGFGLHDATLELHLVVARDGARMTARLPLMKAR